MEIQNKIIDLVSAATKIETSKIQANTNFIDDLNLDSLDMVELMMKMEDEFGIEIPETDTEKLKTVEDVVGYLKSKDVH